MWVQAREVQSWGRWKINTILGPHDHMMTTYDNEHWPHDDLHDGNVLICVGGIPNRPCHMRPPHLSQANAGGTPKERSHKSGSRSHKYMQQTNRKSSTGTAEANGHNARSSNRRRRLSLRCELLSPLGAFPLPFACQNICALQRLNSLNTQHTLREHLYLIFVTFYYVGRPHCEAEGGASQPSFLMLSCYLCIVKQCNIQFTTCLIITIL